MAPTYLITADLGQVSDPTAIAVLERREVWTGRQEVVGDVRAFFDGFEHLPRYYRQPQHRGSYAITHLERLELGTSYTVVPGRLEEIASRIQQAWLQAVFQETGVGNRRLDDTPIDLVVDQTGVGRPVVDLLREAGLDPVAVTITGGDQIVRVSEREWRVPKRELVGAVQASLQARRLQAAASLPDWPVLRKELTNFKAKISLSGHDSYGAGGGVDEWREAPHDDLVLSVALGVWYAEHEAAGFPSVAA